MSGDLTANARGTTIPELGIYLLPGRIRDPARALQEAVEAEELGLSAAWLAERYDLKDMGVLCGAIAARTRRIRVGMASIAVATRHPLMTAAIGATMQETFGNRTLFGVARGLSDVTTSHGFAHYSPEVFEDYCRMLLALWNGETVEYEGPIGSIPGAKLVDPLTAQRPELLMSSWVPGPKGVAMAARTFDGVLLGSELTVEATRECVRQLREECVRIGRDPASLRIYVIVISAPDFSAEDELAVVNARIISHLGFAGVGEQILRANGWDPEVMTRIAEKVAGVDQQAHRHQMLDMARALPREWVETCSAVGSSAQVARRLREYLATGVDEIVLHGCAPNQIGGLVDEWHRTTPAAGEER